MEIKISLIFVVDRRIFVGLLGIRKESWTLWMGYEPISLNLAYFSILIYFGAWCTWFFYVYALIVRLSATSFLRLQIELSGEWTELSECEEWLRTSPLMEWVLLFHEYTWNKCIEKPRVKLLLPKFSWWDTCYSKSPCSRR
jgi:hypothetical protein